MPNIELNAATSVGALTDIVPLPDADVRKWLDERALRGWTESSRRTLHALSLVALDLLAGLAGIATVLGTWNLVSGAGLRPQPNAIPLVAMVICLQPLALRGTGAYRGGRPRVDLVRIAAGIATAALFGWVQARLFGRVEPDLPNKMAYAYSAALVTAYVWLARLGLDAAVAQCYRRGLLQRHTVIIGSSEEARTLLDKCRRSDLRIVAHLAPDAAEEHATLCETSDDGVPFFMGGTSVLRQALSRTGARHVIVTGSLPLVRLDDIIAECFSAGAGVSLRPRVVSELSGMEIDVVQSAAGSLLELRPLRLELPQMAAKRAMDVAITLALLVILWPLLTLIAMAIRLDSCGPIFFSQERAGIGGRPFRMLKFRTMMNGADAMKAQLQHLNESGDPRLFKIKNDPRITRVGRLLRKTSLDELPQLLNVLAGDMSLVGPRPFFTKDLADYQRHHFERLHVLPGITGLWQVSGRSDVVDFEEVIRLDCEYIRGWSLAKDLSILFRTLPAALGRGAY